MQRRRYGRVHVPDRRDRKFLIKQKRTGRLSRKWGVGKLLDQKSTPECVAYALCGMLLGEPISNQFINPHGLYRGAKLVDEYAGENYDGTSVRAGAKVLAALGFISEYLWAFNVDTMINTVLERCPMTVGTNWYAGMANPTAGLLVPKGRLLGGHAYYIFGVDTRTEQFDVRGSYGRTWAIGGNAKIGFDSMARLLKEDGEALIAIEATPTA
jgi:hypothetical protein